MSRATTTLTRAGPDSPAVVRLVQSLVEQGRASAILGNHELNLLRGQRKPGNDWFWGERTHHDERYTPWAYAGADDRAELLAFMSRLPLALVRDDLRVVHAAWHGPSVEKLTGYPSGTEIGRLFDELDAAADAELRASGLIDRAAADKARWRHHFGDPAVAMLMLHSVGELDAARQMLNPLRVLTSGVERCTAQPFYASGQWRFAERVRWWDTYADDVPVSSATTGASTCRLIASNLARVTLTSSLVWHRLHGWGPVVECSVPTSPWAAGTKSGQLLQRRGSLGWRCCDGRNGPWCWILVKALAQPSGRTVTFKIEMNAAFALDASCFP